MTDFNEVVSEIVESVSGGRAAVIMARDGIPIADYAKSGETLDIQTVGIEYTNVLDEIKKASEVLQAGKFEELTVNSESLLLVIRLITDEYFIALAMTPEGNYGKGRYLLRLTAPKLKGEF